VVALKRTAALLSRLTLAKGSPSRAHVELAVVGLWVDAPEAAAKVRTGCSALLFQSFELQNRSKLAGSLVTVTGLS
jgi:hypothetical protein